MHMRDTTQLHVWHDSSRAIRLPFCYMTRSYMWHDTFICVTWLMYMCDTTHSHAWHDAFIRVTWFVMCDMTHAGRYDCHFDEMTRSYVWHDSFIHSFIRVIWLIRVTWLIPTCGMTHAGRCDFRFVKNSSKAWLVICSCLHVMVTARRYCSVVYMYIIYIYITYIYMLYV